MPDFIPTPVPNLPAPPPADRPVAAGETVAPASDDATFYCGDGDINTPFPGERFLVLYVDSAGDCAVIRTAPAGLSPYLYITNYDQIRVVNP